MARALSVLLELPQLEKDAAFATGEWNEATEKVARDLMEPSNSFCHASVSEIVGTPASPFQVESVISKADA